MIAGGVIMAAFKAMAGVTEEQRAGRQQGISLCAAILEGAAQHHRDAGRLMLFLEARAVGTIGADDIADLPAGS